ncbi:hypothetical protein SAMN04487905_101529 [Actinopolyspora xinjiangensis]|uniref:Uncharacterized protein n=1 Tax=Actinopolyspora xinjiangensis TaxID=405564 RepID=A0A1H0PGA8_9ACTN|nr:hypothetical protein SAMN04487905_101529 [Actinopolyspora xinjiangensis]
MAGVLVGEDVGHSIHSGFQRRVLCPRGSCVPTGSSVRTDEWELNVIAGVEYPEDRTSRHR